MEFWRWVSHAKSRHVKSCQVKRAHSIFEKARLGFGNLRLTAPNRTGYANHGDYIFGWKGDALQRALDSPCYVNCTTLKTQDVAAQNKCTVPRQVKEEIDAWVTELPGGHQAEYVKKRWVE